jgi:hypothetical protein
LQISQECRPRYWRLYPTKGRWLPKEEPSPKRRVEVI